MFTIDDLLDRIDVFIDREDQDHYKEIQITEVNHLTDGAALVICADVGDDIWIPFSLLRCDVNKGVYVESWFHSKNF